MYIYIYSETKSRIFNRLSSGAPRSNFGLLTRPIYVVVAAINRTLLVDHVTYVFLTPFSLSGIVGLISLLSFRYSPIRIPYKSRTFLKPSGVSNVYRLRYQIHRGRLLE